MEQLTQLKRLGLFDARVPRYTSYPTAPQFSDAVGADETQAWLRAIPAGGQVSLYVHVPFCRRLCWFCACRTQGTSTLSPVAAYVETLKAELATIARALPEGVTLEHLHWGGGTPTLMSADLILDLARAIFEVAPLAEGAQFSVEIDPNEIDEARLDALAEAGMNRASLGIQDFDAQIQETIGRPQSYDITRKAVEGLRARGIHSLNADILYGLPYQTEAKIADSVQKLLSLNPDRVALFGYAHVPWMAKRQGLIPTDALPAPEERLALFNTARKLFLWDGFEEIGIDHFARPGDGLEVAWRDGTMRRNFQGYTEDSSNTLIGVGASSISRYPQGYAQNDPSTSGYQRRVREGALATSRGHAFAGEDLLRGRVIEMLLCDFRADIDQAASETGTNPAAVLAQAKTLPQAFPEMLTVTDGLIEILPEGRPLARMIARHFDAYAAPASGHSHAV
ncbi:oxygen-independent coproporphyrinogen III oxidase [Psychromarinibacter halotolerans]|uniref:Coproporphyrinogen-III oxidase n=1 Tax=Psychromarinibacter halotolerans TaxID=1775175 RepID=A0ABV7GKG7_9RHOB|nr:oxygen-independent coproporphyrinogen III oxidase [Psychromarinibacter halotolerans]MDF0595459.1 oxygen-independent coproporphyrinogen III oxidase [Psychromarinibacter halotolerans]